MNRKTSVICKDIEPIAAIEEVQSAARSAMEAVIKYIKETEKPTSEKAHNLIDSVLADYDCESPEGHIVSSGIKSAEPHEKGRGVLERGVPIVIDIYPRSKTTGYFADMSRTVCIGPPSIDLRKMYETVLMAQEKAISMVKPGASCMEIHLATEEFFDEAGYYTSGKGKEFKFAEGFVHSLGHGVGTEIHKSPFLGRESEDFLTVGDVITIEPALYYKNIGGIRLEDLLLVTEDGYRNLTNFPKEFSI